MRRSISPSKLNSVLHWRTTPRVFANRLGTKIGTACFTIPTIRSQRWSIMWWLRDKLPILQSSPNRSMSHTAFAAGHPGIGQEGASSCFLTRFRPQRWRYRVRSYRRKWESDVCPPRRWWSGERHHHGLHRHRRQRWVRHR